jgi:hypothetical protein
MAIKVTPEIKARAYLWLAACVARASFEDDELAAQVRMGVLTQTVYDLALRTRKILAQKVVISLNSRWRMEDTSDKLLFVASDVSNVALPMRTFGWGNDDSFLTNIVDKIKNVFTEGIDWINSARLYDVKYIPVTGNPDDETEDNVDPDYYDSYAVDLTMERDPGRMLMFIDPDGGDNGVRFLDI